MTQLKHCSIELKLLKLEESRVCDFYQHPVYFWKNKISCSAVWIRQGYKEMRKDGICLRNVQQIHDILD